MQNDRNEIDAQKDSGNLSTSIPAQSATAALLAKPLEPKDTTVQANPTITASKKRGKRHSRRHGSKGSIDRAKSPTTEALARLDASDDEVLTLTSVGCLPP